MPRIPFRHPRCLSTILSVRYPRESRPLDMWHPCGTYVSGPDGGPEACGYREYLSQDRGQIRHHGRCRRNRCPGDLDAARPEARRCGGQGAQGRAPGGSVTVYQRTPEAQPDTTPGIANPTRLWKTGGHFPPRAVGPLIGGEDFCTAVVPVGGLISKYAMKECIEGHKKRVPEL